MSFHWALPIHARTNNFVQPAAARLPALVRQPGFSLRALESCACRQTTTHPPTNPTFHRFVFLWDFRIFLSLRTTVSYSCIYICTYLRTYIIYVWCTYIRTDFNVHGSLLDQVCITFFFVLLLPVKPNLPSVGCIQPQCDCGGVLFLSYFMTSGVNGSKWDRSGILAQILAMKTPEIFEDYFI